MAPSMFCHRQAIPSNERVQCNAAGQVVLKRKTPWRDGTTHLVMSPLEFMQRLAALVPRPRLHLIRCHGVLAPNAKLRAQVVPSEPDVPAEAAQPVTCEASRAHHRPVRLSWARLLKRVLEIDLEHCANCGGVLKTITAIQEQPAIEKILTHPGLQARAPPRAPARGQTLLHAASARQTHDCSLGPASGAAGIGCARAFQDRGKAANSPG